MMKKISSFSSIEITIMMTSKINTKDTRETSSTSIEMKITRDMSEASRDTPGSRERRTREITKRESIDTRKIS